MKHIIFILAILILSPFSNNSYGQLKNILKKKIEKKVEEKVDEELDKIMEPGEEVAEETSEGNTDSESGSNIGVSNGLLTWSKYDFVPGHILIFEDNQEGEENGEFPSRWDLVNGRVENAVFNEQNIIYFMTENSKVVPYLKNSDQDYLPAVFTVEFDGWFEKNEYTSFYLWFSDVKNQETVGLDPIRISCHRGYLRKDGNIFEGLFPGEDYAWNNDKSMWRHVAIAFTQRSLKVYLDEARVLNIPNMDVNPTGITIGIDNHGTVGVKGINRFLKNIRIAEGGVKLYDKFLQDGKIITNGIRFETGKANIKPESMGVINEIFALLQENPDVNISIEGHTDNMGESEFNQKLSEARAISVMNQLVEMGVKLDRLETMGWGESQPISDNSTPEGKANNRRVELIRM